MINFIIKNKFKDILVILLKKGKDTMKRVLLRIGLK